MNTTVETRPCPACGAALARDDTHWSIFHCPAGCYLCPAPVPASDALAEAGATAAMFLQLGAEDLDVVRRCVVPAVVALAMVMVESDPEFGPRWTAAGKDWVERSHILHEVILWVLTPEAVPA